MATTNYPTTAVKSSVLPMQTAVPPSHTVNPTRSDTVPQQAATGPDDGTRTASPSTSPTSPTSPSGRVSWKDQVIAFAKKTRGTVLRKPTLKEHGDQILAGEASAREPTQKA